MVLLERDAFLDSLLEWAVEARAGVSRVVCLAGEAGVGKTSLVSALRGLLDDADWYVGACDGAFTPEPLGPLFDIAAEMGGAIASVCGEGARRDRLFRTFLEQLTGRSRLTVLVIEDAHWADEATLDLIRFLGRRLRDCPAMLLVTYRDDGLAPESPLRMTLGDLSSERSLRRVTLPALSPDAVRGLAAGSGIAADELYALTAGNPFFVTEVLGTSPSTLPVSATEAVLARVARLSPEGRQLLDAVAVLGGAVAVDVATAVAGEAGGLEECLATGTLVSTPSGVQFRHELSRLAIEAALPAHRRQRLHAAALQALQSATDADDARLSHHAEGSGDAAAVLRHAPAAGRRARALSAHREAAAQLERAMRCADGLPLNERAALCDDLAQELMLVERVPEALDMRRRAMALWREAGDELQYGNSLRILARALLRNFAGAEGEAASAESLAVLEALPPSRALAWAYVNEASARMFSDPRRAIAQARRARDVLTNLGIDDPALVSDSLNSESVACSALGDDGTPLMRRALEVALSAEAEEQVSRAYTNLAVGLAETHQYDAALRVVEDGMPYCEEHDLTLFGNCLRGAYFGILLRQGEWDPAVAACEVELAKPTLSPYNQWDPLLTLATVYARRGDPRLHEPLDAVVALADGADMVALRCELDVLLVEVAWLQGDHRLAAARVRDLVVAPVVPPGSRGAAAVWLRRLTGEQVAVPGDSAWRRQLSEAPLEVATLWREVGSPYEQALALHDSDDEAALRDSLSLLDGLGATAAAGQVRAKMRQLGFRSIPRGPRSATRDDPFGLTARQREVLQLLTDGMTNAEIGGRLFLSERTVDHHVSAVLAKLGVETRRDAVRVASAAGTLEAAVG
ncbi:MAG: LuxR C-terminal-related transcriptional regulator [Mycobacteriales bacterium]